MRLLIAGVLLRVYLFVMTLGYSRRLFVAPFPDQTRASWQAGMEQAFLYFGGLTAEMLLDNAKALVQAHDRHTRQVTFSEPFRAFARYWGFQPRACAPYRARTKGKDESGSRLREAQRHRGPLSCPSAVDLHSCRCGN